MSDFGLCQVRPSTLRFTHDSVSCRFSNGLSLEETFRQFLYDEVDVDDIDCLVAMYYNGKWMVVRGNRRLYLYKKLEKVGKFTTVTVDKQTFQQHLFERQYTSKNMGISIRIRGCPNIENILNQITNEWRNSQGIQISGKPSRRRRQRSKSRNRSGNTNAVVGHSGQRNSNSSEGNSNQNYRRSATSPANYNYSGRSMINVQSSKSSVAKVTTPSIHNYSGTSQTTSQPFRGHTSMDNSNYNYRGHTSMDNSNYNYRAHTSVDNPNHNDWQTNYRPPTPANQSYRGTSLTSVQSSTSTGYNIPRSSSSSINQNRTFTQQTYVPPSGISRYVISSPSEDSDHSLTSQPDNRQPPPPVKSSIYRPGTQRKDKNNGCCTIL